MEVVRVRLDNPPWDYVTNYRPIRWDETWIERPRLWSSAVALALGSPKSVCDPACGDATVVMQAHQLNPISRAVLGDISPDTIAKLLPGDHRLPAWSDRVIGDVFDTLSGIDPVDAIVLTEILEHLDDPDSLLSIAATKANWLVASSPIVPDGNDHTAQHLWAFDMDGYRDMLVAAGWKPEVWMTANCPGHPYAAGFQIWGCSR